MGTRARAIALAVMVAACGVDGGDRHARTTEVEQAVTQCGSSFVEGIDVYDGQGTIDWAKVKAAGRDFAFIKATQGDYNTQTRFATNWADAAANGVVRSAYHFFDATIDGSAQAQAFLAAIGSAGGMTDADLPPMLDLECPASSSQSASKSDDPNCEYTGDDGWVATATLEQRVADWVAAVTAATGRVPIVYSYPSWFADVGDTGSAIAALPLYIASYQSCANVPAPWGSAVFWQYSASGTVSGVSGQVDVDRFFGSAGDLQTWNAGTLPDGGMRDAGVGVDAAGNGELPDGGATGQGGGAGGCGCRAGASSDTGAGAFVLAMIGAAGLRRRRRRARRAR